MFKSIQQNAFTILPVTNKHYLFWSEKKATDIYLFWSEKKATDIICFDQKKATDIIGSDQEKSNRYY